MFICFSLYKKAQNPFSIPHWVSAFYLFVGDPGVGFLITFCQKVTKTFTKSSLNNQRSQETSFVICVLQVVKSSKTNIYCDANSGTGWSRTCLQDWVADGAHALLQGRNEWSPVCLCDANSGTQWSRLPSSRLGSRRCACPFAGEKWMTPGLVSLWHDPDY